MKRRFLFLVFLTFVLLNGCSFNTKPLDNIPKDGKIESQIIFRAFSDIDSSPPVVKESSQPLAGVKIVLIGQDGKVLDVLQTKEDGEVQGQLSVPFDKKYYSTNNKDFELRGTITAIAYKKGFREVVLLEVPVNSYSVQPFYMEPQLPNERNEARAELGNNHRLDILELVDKYSSFAKKP